MWLLVVLFSSDLFDECDGNDFSIICSLLPSASDLTTTLALCSGGTAPPVCTFLTKYILLAHALKTQNRGQQWPTVCLEMVSFIHDSALKYKSKHVLFFFNLWIRIQIRSLRLQWINVCHTNITSNKCFLKILCVNKFYNEDVNCSINQTRCIQQHIHVMDYRRLYFECQSAHFLGKNAVIKQNTYSFVLEFSFFT